MPIVWNILLFVSKLVLIGLIYWVLLIVLRAVRREMSLRLESTPKEAEIAPGRLKLINPGSATTGKVGDVFYLRPETTIGANPSNDLVLKDPYISGQHARLRWDGTEWWIEDLGSRNGTYINQAACPPFAPQTVPPGSILQIGPVSFTLLE